MLTIRKSVGGKPLAGKRPPVFDGANEAADVRGIQTLLNQAYGVTRIPVTGKCDQATVDTIAEFQRLWPGAAVDSRVDPGGTTLRRLNETVAPLKLKRIDHDLIAKGGYVVAYEGEVPPSDYKVLFGVADRATIDVTGRPRKNVIVSDNLPDLLKIIDRLDLWGRSVECRLYVARNARVISQSGPQLLSCPVRPYAGCLGKDLLKRENVGSFTYPGVGDGRYFHVTPIDGKYYFSYKNKFETANQMRGFDCITYVGTVFGANASDKVAMKDGTECGCMAGYGTQLANYLGATAVDMEMKKEAEIKAFFAKNNMGTYIMWKEGHTVLVVDSVVHEFTNRAPKGYHETSVAAWLFGKDVYWIRKLPTNL
jgi:hypothetical protein